MITITRVNNICRNIKNILYSTQVPNLSELIKTSPEDITVACNDDLSYISNFPKGFNVATFVNKSEALQKLLLLKVNLSKIEKNPYQMQRLLNLDFEKDLKKHILFLMSYVPEDRLGWFITKNPDIFKISIDDLIVRINYLQSKHFSDDNIHHIIMKNPFWLMFSTQRIDKRLGFFQTTFELNSKEVRNLAAVQPRLITYSMHHIKTNNFVIKEEMGFEQIEIQSLLMTKPKLWMIDQLSLSRRFNYLHNVMKIPHKMLLNYPGVLMCREFRIKQRNLFLEKLGRAQYTPEKENYVPIIALAEGTDIDFCKKYAKCTVDDYNNFLKTL